MMIGKYGAKPEMLTSVGQRLRAWRKSSSLRLVDVSKQICVSQGSLSDLENDKALPSAGTLTNLCLYSDLDLCWLLTGTGEISSSPSEKNPPEDKKRGFYIYRLEPDLKKLVDGLIRIYQTGDPEHRAHLVGFVTGAQPNLPGHK